MSVCEINRWVWAICFPIWFIIFWNLAPLVIPFVVPIDRYYDLRSVYVSNSLEGDVPTMLVDRTISRDFRGWYEVEIRRAAGSQFEPCGEPIKGPERTYRTASTLPDPLTLDWWMDIPPNKRPCSLTPGQYRVITRIYVRGPMGAILTTERQSPLFQIYSRDQL